MGSDAALSTTMNRIYAAQWAMQTTNAVIDRTFGALTRSQGMITNPMSPVQTAEVGMTALAQYQRQALQARALMGDVIPQNGRFDDGYLSRLASFGAGPQDAVETMRQLAMYSGKVSQNTQQMAENVVMFAKATGQSTQMFARGLGMAGLATQGIADTDMQQAQLVSNVLKLNGGRNTMIEPYLNGLESFRELARAQGHLPVGANGTENAQRFLSQMTQLNPGLYGDRTDLAVQHSQLIAGLGKSAMLPMALQFARERGGTGPDGTGEITFENVLADIEDDPATRRYLMQYLGQNRGYREYLELTNQMPAGLGRSLGRNAENVTVDFEREDALGLLTDARVKGQEATHPIDVSNARAMDKFTDATNTFNQAVQTFSQSQANAQADHPIVNSTLNGILKGLVGVAALKYIGGLVAGGSAVPGALTGGGLMAGLAEGAAAMTTAAVALPLAAAASAGWAGYEGYKAYAETQAINDYERASANNPEYLEAMRRIRARRAGQQSGSLPGVGSNRIEDLPNAESQALAREMQRAARAAGHNFTFTSTFRDEERTNAIYRLQQRRKPYTGAGDHGSGGFDVQGDQAFYEWLKRWMRDRGLSDNLVDESRNYNHMHIKPGAGPAIADEISAATVDLARATRAAADSTARLSQAVADTAGKRQATPRP